MSFVPIKMNTVALATIAVIAALGMIVRFTLQIPVIPDLVELTPGFMFSILGGILGGIPGGIIAGTAVGIGGALAGGSLSILTLFGNLFLGIGGGYAIYFAKRDTIKYNVLVILGAGLIGGLIPSMTLFYTIGVPFVANLSIASIDMIQGFLWAFLAIVVEKNILRPIVGHYLYSEVEIQELDVQEG
ncbi:hypothetical protein E4H12_07245 [Candidatus Thorarchaeota archaeon]|nr:hypothetical protein [Candidatus Thorarchaeota archaeon]TFG98003.1 MAG: hypothetical protein E4H12_07245 [Candidatus Thorarchaeota archaeon]